MNSMYNNAIFVTRADQLPLGEHWAILEFSSLTIPGDERSRTNPGHGYPERQEPIVQYIAFLQQSDFEAELISRADRPGSTVGLRVVADRFTITRVVRTRVEQA
jgi:hypothetical protein